MPKKNKKHLHRRKLRIHATLYASCLVIALMSAGGVFATVARVSGSSNVNLSFTIADENPITASPPIPIPGNSGPLPPSPTMPTPPEPTSPSVPPIPLTMQIETSAGVIPDAGTISSSGTQSTVPIMTDVRPKFHGHVGIPGAVVILELHSAQIITSTVIVDANGDWSWQPTKDLAIGSHQLLITVMDQNETTQLGSMTFSFEIASSLPGDDTSHPRTLPQSNTTKPRTSLVLPAPTAQNSRVLFDVRVKVMELDANNELQPGKNILAQVSLLNIGSPGYLVDTAVTYRLLDPNNDPIFEQHETVGVASRTSYLKVFTTKPGMKQGTYKLEVTADYEDTEATAYDEFTIRGGPIIPLASTTQVDATLVMQILVGVLGLALFAAYLEHYQVENLSRIIHQVTDSDLKKNRLIS